MSAILLRLGAACALVLLGTAGLLAETPAAEISLDDDLELERLDDRLWLYRATIEMNGRPVESNGLVVAGSEGALVIDTPWNDVLTALLLDWVEERLGGVTGVVATHFHPDRLGGIAAVRSRQIASYGHAETARLAIEHDLPPPGSTFDREMTLSTGDQTVELFFPGPGHSPDNVVAWLPERRLLFGGCLLKSTSWSSLGYLGDAVVTGWADSLETLLARYPDARTVLPGHGAGGDLGVVRHTLDLVRRHLAGAPEPSPSTGAASRQRGVSWVAQPYAVEAENFDSLVAANVDWIVQTPFGWQIGLQGTVELETEGKIFWGERDVGLEVTTRLARARGVKTLLKPHVWIRRGGGKWRSDISMADEDGWRRWFDSYREFILHYARLAERLGIEALCIGTELRQTVVHRPDDWRRIIAAIRAVYSGELTYAANWYQEYLEVPFWDRLDYVGIQAYFPLTARERPSLAELRSGWQAHLAEIEALQRRVGKPVLFTEIGYKSTPGATAEPWRWLKSDEYESLPVDLELQADAYRAFFEVFWPRPWVAGAYFWKWFPVAPAPDNPGFTPQGKPAERVLATWYGGA